MTGLSNDPQSEARYQALHALPTGPEAIPRLVAALYDESWRVRKLAAELLARAEASPPLLNALLEVLADRAQLGARNAAASALALLGGEAVPPLVGLLRHADADQRKLAADVLGEVRRAEAVPALLLSLADADPNVQAAAAEALGRIGGHEACRALEGLLRSPRALLQVAALEGLAQQGHAPPLPLVLPLVEPLETRRSAYRLLGQIAHPAAFALLLNGLAAAAREAALEGLGTREAPPSADGEAAIAAAIRRVPDALGWLTRSLQSDQLPVRRGALWAAAAWGKPGLAIAVAQAASGGPLGEAALAVLLRLGLAGARVLLGVDGAPLAALSPEGRAVATEAIIRAADPVLVPALTVLAEDGEHELQSLASRALGRCRTVDALPPLLALLESDALSSQAARSLVSLGATFPAEVTRLLAAVLARRIRPHALRAFVQIAPRPEALEVLKRAGRDPVEAVRAATAECAVLCEGQGVAFLAQAMADESALVRRAAVRAMGRASEAEVLPLLERALEDASALVLAAAATAAGELGASSVQGQLERLTAHAESAVALAALLSLSELGLATEAVLGRCCSHADPEVVKAALTFVAAQPQVGALAGPLLAHPRWDVRVAAARALAAGAGREALVPLHRALERETDPMARELMVAAAATLAER